MIQMFYFLIGRKTSNRSADLARYHWLSVASLHESLCYDKIITQAEFVL